MERVEDSLDPTDKQYPEMRDKTANLSKAKVSGLFSKSFCVPSNCSDDFVRVPCSSVRDASVSFSCSMKKC